MNPLPGHRPGTTSFEASPGDTLSRAPTHILFPYRPSRRGDRALRAAAELARETGAQLTVLAPVVNQENGRRCCGIQDERWMDMVREAAAADLERARRALDGGSGATFVTAEGEAFRGVVKQFGREHGCDLTVMAPSVLGALARRRGKRALNAQGPPVGDVRQSREALRPQVQTSSLADLLQRGEEGPE